MVASSGPKQLSAGRTRGQGFQNKSLVNVKHHREGTWDIRGASGDLNQTSSARTVLFLLFSMYGVENTSIF